MTMLARRSRLARDPSVQVDQTETPRSAHFESWDATGSEKAINGSLGGLQLLSDFAERRNPADRNSSENLERKMVGRDGIESPTPGFSVSWSIGGIASFFNDLRPSPGMTVVTVHRDRLHAVAPA
jgi:hypothetical protein